MSMNQSDDPLAALPPARAQERETDAELGWLIETGRNPPTYWDGRGVQPTDFTDNPNDALRFARKQDAEMVRNWLLSQWSFFTKSVEHSWFRPDQPVERREP